MVEGKPCKRTISFTNKLATVTVKKDGLIPRSGYIWLIDLQPPKQYPGLKSEVSLQRNQEIHPPKLEGMGNGWRKPAGFKDECFCCLKMMQLCTYLATDFRIPIRNHSPAKCWYVLNSPAWPPIAESWYSLSNLSTKIDWGGKTNLPLYRTIPFS